eukprot:scaffold81389_cov30-Tisochrysis_lutea.AAC.4
MPSPEGPYAISRYPRAVRSPRITRSQYPVQVGRCARVVLACEASWNHPREFGAECCPLEQGRDENSDESARAKPVRWLALARRSIERLGHTSAAKSSSVSSHNSVSCGMRMLAALSSRKAECNSPLRI